MLGILLTLVELADPQHGNREPSPAHHRHDNPARSGYAALSVRDHEDRPEWLIIMNKAINLRQEEDGK